MDSERSYVPFLKKIHPKDQRKDSAPHVMKQLDPSTLYVYHETTAAPETHNSQYIIITSCYNLYTPKFVKIIKKKALPTCSHDKDFLFDKELQNQSM